MKKILSKYDQCFNPMRDIAKSYLEPVSLLIARIYIAKIFFMSGYGKLMDTLNGDFASVVYLFTEIHPVPFLPPELAAFMGMGGEVVFGALLAFGLLGRVSAFALLVMALVIQYAVPAQYGIANDDHYFWMLLLFVIVSFGPGKLSGDHFLLKYIRTA
ncbi:MAG: DoxX family protein [Pseudomonadota bacterium]|jgi:putative oxidoreductase|nr:DoxX family protein [Alphaproteobacteria bacterium]MEC7703509.1 DoxX family protein [Pseudomonadota bacterium]MED5423483.1 DoxX family protein [Pseudomonadota bacterium]MEE3322728.1 DoxX family protein [Pseudomonadota bacterium]|tara:strand:- start:67 stop:540 length:474 start_codon:yes stop_codon:yes gene_type:complete